jgi:hypothetical protein
MKIIVLVICSLPPGRARTDRPVNSPASTPDGIATAVLGCATKEVRLVPPRRDHREPWAGIREPMGAYRRA